MRLSSPTNATFFRNQGLGTIFTRSAGVFQFSAANFDVNESAQTFSVTVARTGGTFGGWHGLTPDDSLLVLTRTEDSEIYALDWEAP